jgi:hypothetical protein
MLIYINKSKARREPIEGVASLPSAHSKKLRAALRLSFLAVTTLFNALWLSDPNSQAPSNLARF